MKELSLRKSNGKGHFEPCKVCVRKYRCEAIARAAHVIGSIAGRGAVSRAPADPGTFVAVQKCMRSLLAVALVAIFVSSCTVTRVSHFGPLPGRQSLITLVVTEDRNVVRRECQSGEQAAIVGCETLLYTSLGEAGDVRTVKIVRYTDHLPSAMAMEIEAHELCHAVAALQGILDPCHAENGGMLQSALPPSPITGQWR